MVAEPEPVGPKRIGQDNRAARLDVSLRDFGDALRVRQVPGVGKIADGQPARLQLRTPRAVCENGRAPHELLDTSMHECQRLFRTQVLRLQPPRLRRSAGALPAPKLR